MAHSGFSNKLKPPSSSQKILSKMIGRLGFRAFFVALVFLVIPLVIHGWVSYRDDYEFRKKLLFLGLSSIATGKARFAEEVIQDKADTAEVLSAAMRMGLSRDALSQLFIEVSQQKNTDSVFFQEMNSQGEFLCTLSAEPQLVGRKNIYLPQQMEAVRQKQTAFLDLDPVTGLKEILVAVAVPRDHTEAILGVMTVGLDALKWLDWIALTSNAPIPFQLSLVEGNGEVFLNQRDRFDAHNAWLFAIDPAYDAETLFEQIAASPDGKAYLSIFGKKKRWLGISVPVPGTGFSLLAHATSDLVSAAPSSALLSRFLTSAVIFLSVGGGLALLIMIRISRPFNALVQVMGEVEQGNMLARYHRDPMGFEINALGNLFNRMIDAVIRHTEEARTERVAREILSKELKIGHDIQRSILPNLKPDFPGVAIATGFQGAKEVAGDFYDMFITQEKTLVVSVADAAGKGISACLYSFLVRSMLRSLASTTHEMGAMIDKTNALFCLDTADSGNFVTAWVGMLDAGSKRLHYVSCGHLPALLRRADGKIEELNTEGIALGVVPEMPVHIGSVELKLGDVLILYTDGVTETQNSYLELFGKPRLIEVIAQKDGSAERLIEAILEEVEAFSQGAPLFDDRTVLVMEMTV